MIAFDKSKKEIKSDWILEHYDPRKQIIVVWNASGEQIQMIVQWWTKKKIAKIASKKVTTKRIYVRSR